MDAGSPSCVRCGFCLPACPTYDLLGTELDSPRGRLALMDALASGRAAPTAGVIEHLDLCLGCRACEPACPSGVRYGEHLHEARAALRNHPARDRGVRRLERLALAAVALPPALLGAGARLLAPLVRAGVVGWLARWLPGRLGAAAGLLAATCPRPLRLPPRLPAARRREDGRAPRVGLLTGCVGAAIFGDVNRSAARLLSAAGCEVVVPRDQVCCGALHAHSGDDDGARALLRRNLDAFEAAGPLDAIVVTAAGCGSALKECASLFPIDDPLHARATRFAASVRDALELLDDLGLPSPDHAVDGAVACQDACHLAHAQRRPGLASRLLAQVPGLRLLPLAQADRCCGSAGIANLLHPGPTGELGRRKLEALQRAGASVVAAANPGCLLHLAARARESGVALTAVHPLTLLERACLGPPSSVTRP